MAQDKPQQRSQASGIETVEKANSRKLAICPKNPDHAGAIVYKRVGKIRYCKCNTCGCEPWKQIVDSDERDEFLETLRQSLEATPTQTIGNIESIVFPMAEVKKIVDRIKALLSVA